MRIIKSICPGLTLAGSILGLALVAMPSSAATPPELSISVAGYGSVTVDSLATESYNMAAGETGTSCNGSTCAGTIVIGNGTNGLQTGQISWTGTIGDFTGTITGTSSHVVTQPQLDVLVSGLTTNTTGGVITIGWTDVGFTVGSTPANMNVTGGGLGTQSFKSYVDNTNVAFGTGTLVNTLTSSGTASGTGPTSSPFSMTDVAVLTLPSGVGSNLPPDSLDFLFNDTPSALSVSCGTLAAGTVGTSYSAALAASGGVSPYTYSIASGSISPLTLNPTTGAISGTPSAAGTLTFTAGVKDSSGNTASNTAVSSSCSIIVTVPKTTPPLKVTCPTSSATVGTYYSSKVVVTGGVPNYTFKIAYGALPAGLTLNTSTGAITGTPTTAQTGAFKIQVTDSAGTIAYTACSGTCSGGVNVTYGGSAPQNGYGDKGQSCDYNSNGVHVTAYGYSTGGSACDLYSSYVSGGPSLGLNNHYNSNQIDTGHFVQFDVSNNNNLGATSCALNVNSTEWNASFDVYGSNTKGSLGTLLQSNVQACLSGYQTVPNANKYHYICVKAHQGDVAVACLQFTYSCACAIDVAQSQGSNCYSGSNNNDWWGGNSGGNYGGNNYGGGGNSGSGQGDGVGQCGW